MEMMGEMDMGGMSMFFTAGTNVTILFDSWRTIDEWSMLGSVVSTYRFHYNNKFHFHVPKIKNPIANCNYHFHDWVYVTYLGSDHPYGIRVRSFKVFSGIPNAQACILRRKT